MDEHVGAEGLGEQVRIGLLMVVKMMMVIAIMRRVTDVQAPELILMNTDDNV